MATVADIRAAIAASFTSLSPDVQVSAYMLDAPTPPSICVYPAPFEYDLTLHRGFDLLMFTVRVVVQPTLDVAWQTNLDPYARGATSVKTLVEADTTLGGVVAGVRVAHFDGYKKYVPDTGQGQPLPGAEWTLEVHAAG